MEQLKTFIYLLLGMSRALDPAAGEPGHMTCYFKSSAALYFQLPHCQHFQIYSQMSSFSKEPRVNVDERPTQRKTDDQSKYMQLLTLDAL